MENATSLAVSIKNKKYILRWESKHDAFCHELTQINLLIKYHNGQLCANKNKGKNSRHTYDLKILLISGCRLFRIEIFGNDSYQNPFLSSSRRVFSFINYLWTYSEFFQCL